MFCTKIKSTTRLRWYGLAILLELTMAIETVAQSGGPLSGCLPAAHGQVVRHSYYTLSYIEAHEQAEWVAYFLAPDMLPAVYQRKNSFRPDPAVNTGSATYSDYTSAKGYDAGHLLPCRNMQFDCQAMAETFLMSNISPQVSAFNRQKWAQLERLERNMAMDNGGIYVVTGPVLTAVDSCIGITTQISVPKYYYKIMACDATPGKPKAIAFLLPNRINTLPLERYVVSIDSVEAFTGLDFFPTLEDGLEARLEAQANPSSWNFTNPISSFGYYEKPRRCGSSKSSAAGTTSSALSTH